MGIYTRRSTIMWPNDSNKRYINDFSCFPSNWQSSIFDVRIYRVTFTEWYLTWRWKTVHSESSLLLFNAGSGDEKDDDTTRDYPLGRSSNTSGLVVWSCLAAHTPDPLPSWIPERVRTRMRNILEEEKI